MNLLALDTSSEASSVAIYADGKLTSFFEMTPRAHTERILPMVDECLDKAGLTKSELNFIAFGRGPGSFTGVRIAASVAQGIAYSLDIPIIPVSTLAALAQAEMNESQSDKVISIVDARMKEVYHGEYTRNENGIAELVGEERVCSPEQLIAPANGEWVGVGNGWLEYTQSLENLFSERVSRIKHDVFPRASEMALIGSSMAERGNYLSAAEGLPVYLRDKVAQTMDERKSQQDK